MALLKFDKELSKVEIYAIGRELATVMGKDMTANGQRISTWPESKRELVTTFEKPVLVTDLHKIYQLAPGLRDTVDTLLKNSLRHTAYDTSEFRFDQSRYPTVWGPSIDTLLFCRALSKLDLSDTRFALEAGPGSGFITHRVLDILPNLQKMTAVDINPEAVQSCEDNISDSRKAVYTGSALDFLDNHPDGGADKYDVVLTNPPYIPRPKTICDNPYEGLDLLIGILQRAPVILSGKGRVIYTASNLSNSILDPVLAAMPITTIKVDEMTVPLKVNNVRNNEQWLEYLLQHGLEQRYHDGHDLWQTITVYEARAK